MIKHSLFSTSIFRIYKNLYDSDSIKVASISRNIGNILYYQNKYDQALEFYQRSLAIRERLGPFNHTSISNTQAAHYKSKENMTKLTIIIVEWLLYLKNFILPVIRKLSSI